MYLRQFNLFPIVFNQTGSSKGDLVIPENVEVVFHADPADLFSSNTIDYFRVTEDLFSQPLSLKDIKQGRKTKNCFLLAALQSILALPEGHLIIKSMMQDKGNQVIVRLFDEYKKPHYLLIEKTIPKNSGIFSDGALWVKILEKACAIFEGKKSVTKGGYSDQAIKILTGADSNNYYEGYLSLPFQSRSRLSSLNSFVDGGMIYLFHELMRVSLGTPKVIRDRIYREVFLNNENHFKDWMKWIDKKKKYWEEIIKNNHPITLAHVKQFFLLWPKKCLAESAIKQVKTWIMDNKILSGPKLSGQYSAEELNIFFSIKKRLENNFPIVVETGSEIEDGLLPTHSYAVVGVEDNSETTRKYIYVANPHGEPRSWLEKLISMGGRTAIDIHKWESNIDWEIKIKSSSSPYARMELSDFCQSFENILYTESVSVEAITQRIKVAHAPIYK